MPQEMIFASPSKNLRGLKALISGDIADEIINDHELAQRKAEESAARRYEAVEWLRRMDRSAWESLSKEPSEEEFCMALRNGLILCNVLNKVHPGAVHKVVENPVATVQSTEGAAAQSAIQYFENTRNFLVAVANMKLLTFEASDLEKGGSSSKVVDCILCLKGFHEWKLAGGVGVWRYGGLVKITGNRHHHSAESQSAESLDSDESFDEYKPPEHEQLLEFLHRSGKVSMEESQATKALCLLFDRFGLGILQAYLTERNYLQDFPLNAMVIDTVIRKVVKDFSAVLVSEGIQLGLLLKKILKSKTMAITNEEFLDAISQYLRQRNNDQTELCVCGGRREVVSPTVSHAAEYKDIIDDQQKQIKELKSFFDETKLEVQNVQLQWDAEMRRIDGHVESLEVASSSYYKVLEENRQLYNQVQDLKGSIRVYCRVRPFLPCQSDSQSTVDYIGENGNIMIVHPHKQGRDARRVFSFNKVFGTNVSQQQIYADTQPLIRSVLDGYNVCIFAYGQTGSGKTYTMSGPDLTTEETWGVNYRALRDLFQISKSRKDVIEYEVGVQMIEIYNEQVRDLLVLDGSTRRLDIRNHSQLNGLNVPDASLVRVSCTQDVLNLMRIGQRNRAVGATALNERSSRSHSVLTVHVQGKELQSGSILKGCLHLVDLAGSERVEKSEAVGERLKEAQHINKSLSALGDVISSLAQKSAYIPYRNSKLTQVLQDSLGGQAKTLMFVHINPEVNAVGETVSTLKFAERVASIELGQARANKETTEIRDLKEEISQLKKALEKKEAELEHLKCAKSTLESQKARAVSPLHVPRAGRNIDEKSSEGTSRSSGKQRRSRVPTGLTDNEAIPKMPFIAEERLASPGSPRSPSPPVRRSLSTDRGAIIRSKLRPEVTEKPISRPQFPARVSINKSIANEDSISDALHGKVHPANEDHEQFKQVFSVRRGGAIRKNKHDSRAKAKHQSSVSLADTENPGKSDFFEPENELGLLGSPVYINSKSKKLHQNSSRVSQNLEPRGAVQTIESLLNVTTRNPKEASNITSMSELRRSRSTPRGKFFMLP